ELAERGGRHARSVPACPGSSAGWPGRLPEKPRLAHALHHELPSSVAIVGERRDAVAAFTACAGEIAAGNAGPAMRTRSRPMA
ncbi:hypothetical protein, partial [Thermomonas sp.]|uniref:hypothetical protein n=1 Tax=Thermomonas sp. TaxID=1971895 RepID=UPI003D0972E0